MNRATTIIADIEKYIRELEELNIKTIQDLKDKKNLYASSMVLFTIFNRIIDIGQELVLSKKLGMPATYGQIFSILHKEGIISKKLPSELIEIVKIRNKLSHEYFTFTQNDVFTGIKKIKYVKEFVKVIKEVIKKENRKRE